ncbi:MAG: T9SS type A sorting domain-containing protein [Cytophagales bacterium]|nr:T9SS type A sorting domain-containing protein [Cytophagales bacterium]
MNTISTQKQNLSIYPNPATSYISLESTSDEVVNIYNAIGELVLTSDEKEMIDISELATGVYVIKEEYITRFVKE